MKTSAQIVTVSELLNLLNDCDFNDYDIFEYGADIDYCNVITGITVRQDGLILIHKGFLNPVTYRTLLSHRLILI